MKHTHVKFYPWMKLNPLSMEGEFTQSNCVLTK